MSRRSRLRKTGYGCGFRIAAISAAAAMACRLLACYTRQRTHHDTDDLIKKSERKFSTFFHAASVLMSITTFEEGRIIDVNEVAMRAFGYERDELMGETVHHAHIWKDPADRERALKILEEGGSIRNMEIKVTGKGGETMFGLLSAESVVLDGERYILSVVRDVTERKQAEEEIKRLNAELAARALELETINRELEGFNYTVAHDLRSPINAMSSSFQAIEIMCGDRLSQECREFLQSGYRSTHRMNRLIGALLDFSRMAHVEPRREKVDLSAMAREVVSELRQAAPGRDVKIVIAEGVTADADATLLRIVLDNLIGNAWKYSNRQEQPVIEVGATTVDQQQAFFVRDNGSGFDKAAAEKMFLPFQRLSGAETANGFGIGLATVERIIQRHGGRIWAESEPTKGACFYFTLRSPLEPEVNPR